MRRTITWSLLGIMLLGSSASGEGGPKANDVKTFMQLKRKYAGQAFEGLVDGDFGAIRKNAEAMSLLTEDETWQILQTPEYLRYSTEFRNAANDLANAAEKKNLDRASIAYIDLTRKCIECHRHVRDVRSVSREGFRFR